MSDIRSRKKVNVCFAKFLLVEIYGASGIPRRNLRGYGHSYRPNNYCRNISFCLIHWSHLRHICRLRLDVQAETKILF